MEEQLGIRRKHGTMYSIEDLALLLLEFKIANGGLSAEDCEAITCGYFKAFWKHCYE